MSPRSPLTLAFLTLPVVFGLLTLVVVLQVLTGGEFARLLGSGAAFLVARWVASARGVGMAELGWVRPSFRSVGFGLVLGGGLVAAVAAVMVVAGWYSLTWSGAWSELLQALGFGVLVGLFEEAVFRSIWFGGFEPALGSWLTLGLSALLFGLLHSFNPGATTVSSLSIALTGGLLLGAVFVGYRDLWLVAGIHAAWNAVLGGLFGMPVSGSSPNDALLSAVEQGPDLWTGGSFGPEASLIAIAIVGGTGVWLLAKAARGGTVVGPMWRTASVDPRRA